MKLNKAAIKSWLQLIRLPNLFTVPGDPLVGVYLGIGYTGWEVPALKIFLVAVASILIYTFGLVLNDIVDFDEDSERRPERPLPSGRIKIDSALKLAYSLPVLALIMLLYCGRNPFMFGAILTGLVYAYNVYMREDKIQAAVTMGACRGFNILLGASLVTIHWANFTAALALTVYIAFVTYFAADEHKDNKCGKEVLGVGFSFVIGLLLVAFVSSFFMKVRYDFILLLLIFVPVMGYQIFSLYNKETPAAKIQKKTGFFIRFIIIWQAFILYYCGDTYIMPNILICLSCSLPLMSKYIKGS